MNARELCAEQAEDEGLWFQAQTAPEAYLQAALRALHAAVEFGEWQDISAAPKEMPRVYLVANAKGQVAPHIGGVIHNSTGSAWDWSYDEAVTNWQPLPEPPK